MRLTRLALTAAAIAAVIPALGAGDALAAGSTTLTYTGSEQTYTVPAGTHFLRVRAVGGRGGGAYYSGLGGRATATLPVTPGQILYVYVGGNGAGGANAPGGFNGGGNASALGGGASGGGATDVRAVSGDLASRLLVAGGGGGYGAGDNTYGSDGGSGGSPTGQDAINFCCVAGPGRGGTGAAGGAGGSASGGDVAGSAGSLGQGGTAGFHSTAGGGGGGGGYYGGGGGAGFGGGGGSSYAAPQTTNAVFGVDSGASSVTFEPLGLTPTAPSVTFAQTPQQTLSAGQDVTLTNDGSVTMRIYQLRFNGADEDDFFATHNNCDVDLAPGQSCSVRVKFSPSAKGARSATLTLRAVSQGPNGGEVSATVALSGTGGDLPSGTQGPAGQNGKRGKRGERGRSGATKPGSRAACKVTRLGAGSRVACAFKKRVGKRAHVTLRDRRGQVAAALGTGTRRMIFVTGRPVRGKLSVWVVVGPDRVYPVDRR
jgi:hypothetical protein